MIKIRDLVFKYQGANNNALDGVSFDIPKGKYVAILGHNGSGKSTLSKILSGLYKPTSGEMYLDDVLINKETLSKVREKVGIVFQNPDNQFIGATVEDDIAFGLENKRIDNEKMKQIIETLLSKVGMQKFIKKEPHMLSGGQKQKVAIASILALDSDIIIFDEVTSMLDPKGKKEVLKIIKEIREERNKTLISITHDMDEAINADYCLVFSKGKLIANGKPNDILKNKEIISVAKIDSPFVYRLSSLIEGIEPTYDEDEFLEALWK